MPSKDAAVIAAHAARDRPDATAAGTDAGSLGVPGAVVLVAACAAGVSVAAAVESLCNDFTISAASLP
mgnify:CR=1 FL=1